MTKQQMTKQQIFTKVAKHLLSMKKQAVSPAGACQYRPRAGGACAVGCLIKDEEYTPEMEGRTVYMLANSSMLPLRLEREVNFLTSLQNLHDSTSNWTAKGIRRRVLRSFARKHDLQYPS